MAEGTDKKALENSNACLRGVRLAGMPAEKLWDFRCRNGCIDSILPHSTPSDRMEPPDKSSHQPPLVIPSLCHPHIHLDKCFLLSHPKFSDLVVQSGDFAEALSLTNKAKARFEHEDLMERGRALIEESSNFGVTSMRAFIEVDLTVELKCLNAGLALKREFEDRCHIQICVFAQDPLFSYDGHTKPNLDVPRSLVCVLGRDPLFYYNEDGQPSLKVPTSLTGLEMQDLFEKAVSMAGVDVVGSTPYVESNELHAKLNISWTTDLAVRYRKHLDFHLDYNLDETPMIWTVIDALGKIKQNKDVDNENRNEALTNFPLVTLGHCTRLTLFDPGAWKRVLHEMAQNSIQISFIGLPTSDIFMMGRPTDVATLHERARGTLQIPLLIRDHNIDCAIGINNVGNAFTPYGSCDPLALASLGVGIYQAGTKADAELLLECVSSRARKAIGLGTETSLTMREGDVADFVVFGMSGEKQGFRSRKSVHEVVYDAGPDRVVFKGGKVVSR